MINLKLKTALKTNSAKTIYKILGVLVLVVTLWLSAVLWSDHNKVVFPSKWVEFVFRINTPKIEKRELAVVYAYVDQETLDEIVKDSGNPTVAEYICKKWGPTHCATAVAVAKAESGLRCDAMNINTNNTVDFGVFQINSVHFKKGGEWNLANVADCYKNIDLAYELYQQQGFEPWVAYWSKSYLAQLGK